MPKKIRNKYDINSAKHTGDTKTGNNSSTNNNSGKNNGYNDRNE